MLHLQRNMKLGTSPSARNPQATHSLKRHLMIAFTEPGPVLGSVYTGWGEGSSRTWCQSCLLGSNLGSKENWGKKLHWGHLFHISIWIKEHTSWIYFLERDPEISFWRLKCCFEGDLWPYLTYTYTLRIGPLKILYLGCVSMAEQWIRSGLSGTLRTLSFSKK